MHRTVRDSRYALIEEAAHMAPMEQTDKLARLTLAFLNN
jgi:pimeloyl-ACP methyl ester carboxylesterase